MSCIFCDLQKQPELVLWDDEYSYLIVDIGPLSRGHLLLIPKEHTEYMHELNDLTLSKMLINIKNIVLKLGYDKYNLLQNNGHIQSVNHVHFHIVPANNTNDSLSINWVVQDVDSEYVKRTQEKVRAILAKK